MKTITRQILTTSHVDKQGDQFTIGALSSMVDQANSSYIPFGVEHDPRIAPLGRIRKARLIPLPDGQCAVEGDIEFFDPQGSVPFAGTERLVKLPSLEEPVIGYDRSYRDRENQKLIRDIAKLLGSKPKEEFKKSLDPVSLLEILGLFIIGQFAGGFLQKVGADAWDSIKSKLKRLTQTGPSGQLVCFEFYAQREAGRVAIEVILTAPTPADVEIFFSEHLPVLYEALKPVLQTENLSKLVLESKGGKSEILYGMRSDALPIKFKANALNMPSRGNHGETRRKEKRKGKRK